MSNYHQISLRNSSKKRVPVTAPHAGVVFDNEMNPIDYVDVSNRTFEQLDFSTSNSLSNEINLNRVHCSFSFLFVRSDII